jgi:hypothetical protein
MRDAANTATQQMCADLDRLSVTAQYVTTYDGLGSYTLNFSESSPASSASIDASQDLGSVRSACCSTPSVRNLNPSVHDFLCSMFTIVFSWTTISRAASILRKSPRCSTRYSWRPYVTSRLRLRPDRPFTRFAMCHSREAAMSAFGDQYVLAHCQVGISLTEAELEQLSPEETCSYLILSKTRRRPSWMRLLTFILSISYTQSVTGASTSCSTQHRSFKAGSRLSV